MTNYSDFSSEPPQPQPQVRRLPLPMSKPFVTYVLIAAIVIVWLLMEAAGGSTDTRILVRFGANFGPLILEGETWRLFTSMFLHIGFLHLFFNGYALFIFGIEMESLYGSDRFLTIYVLSGLFGSLVSFAWRGPNVLSAGASGAIFGVVGMNLAFFLIHHKSFGTLGRQRVMNTLVIIGINLVFGFTVPGIDNMAHMGGLVSGFALGYGLTPRYKTVDEYTLNPRVVDTISLINRWWVPTLAVILLAGGVSGALSLWSG